MEQEVDKMNAVNEMMLEFPKQNKEISHLIIDPTYQDHLKV